MATCTDPQITILSTKRAILLTYLIYNSLKYAYILYYLWKYYHYPLYLTEQHHKKHNANVSTPTIEKECIILILLSLMTQIYISPLLVVPL
jgi:hypothetical protein